MQTEAYHLLIALQKKWYQQRFIEKSLLSLGVTALPMAFAAWWWQWPIAGFLLAWLLAALPFFRWFWGSGSPNSQSVANWLDQQYPQLENSSWLLLDPAPTRLAQLQQEKIAKRLLSLRPMQPPAKLLPTAGFSLLSLVFALLLLNFMPIPTTPTAATPPPKIQNISNTAVADTAYQPPILESWAVEVVPPAYTRLPPAKMDVAAVEAPEGSLLRWSIGFNGQPLTPELQLSGIGQLPLKETDNRWVASHQLSEKGFYRLQFSDRRDSLHFTDYYPLVAIKDRPPLLQVSGLPAYQSIAPDASRQLAVKVSLSDDYGLASATLVATVSQGEGESVKFREARIPLMEPATQQWNKTKDVSHELDLNTLGMELGDELYFFVEATDNKSGNPQKSRTESYFISLQDTTETEGMTIDGLGVDLVPAYFRSQRQLIIDTEALIAKKDQLSERDFKDQSNNIGIDQKILRLRYGKFLGEEFESGGEQTGSHNHNESEEHEDHDDHEGHDHEGHDHEDHDHAAHEDETSAPVELAHDHDHEDVTLANGTKVPAEFMHIHDNAEMATLFDEGLRATLKEALAEMWDAELYLRTGRPSDALPHEYKALEIIKQVQRKSRVYVERVGFEAPAFNKAEKRLTGDLKEVEEIRKNLTTQNEQLYPNLYKVMPVLEQLKERGRAIVSSEAPLLQAAGEELAELAIEQPGRYLPAMQALQSLMHANMPATMQRQTAQIAIKGIATAIPQAKNHPQPQTKSNRPLEQLYLKKISATR